MKSIEEDAKQILQTQNQASVFIAWLESYVAREGDKEEGHTWMHAKRGLGDYIYITDGILQRYKDFCKRTGNAPFESLNQLAVDLTAHTGENCKVTVTDIGLDEEIDGYSGKVVEYTVPYKKRKVVKVPLSIQGKLDMTVSGAGTGGGGPAAAA